MQLKCGSCRSSIPAADVNIDLGIAKCVACDDVFSFLEVVGGARGARPVVETPKRFVVENWGSELVITRSWFNHSVWALSGFCIFWDGFLAVWYWIGIHELLRGSHGSGMIWLMLVFPVLHVAVGVGLTYAVLCMIFNKTVIRVSGGELTVWTGPLPCGNNRRLFTSEIRQLFCTETKVRGEDSVHRSYDVMALMRDMSRVKLVSGLEELEQAWFIEQQVEGHLKIEDERVAGEVRQVRNAECGVRNEWQAAS